MLAAVAAVDGVVQQIQQVDLVVQEEVVQVLMVHLRQLPVLMEQQIAVAVAVELVEDFLLIQLTAVQVVQVL
jgi:hypothetical protein